MSTVESIEQAVQKLAPAELAKFRRWFAEFDEAVWDAQIERDAADGKLDALAAEALEEFHSGKAVELGGISLPPGSGRDAPRDLQFIAGKPNGR